jgi:hypothetical protein
MTVNNKYLVCRFIIDSIPGNTARLLSSAGSLPASSAETAGPANERDSFTMSEWPHSCAYIGAGLG